MPFSHLWEDLLWNFLLFCNFLQHFYDHNYHLWIFIIKFLTFQMSHFRTFDQNSKFIIWHDLCMKYMLLGSRSSNMAFVFHFDLLEVIFNNLWLEVETQSSLLGVLYVNAHVIQGQGNFSMVWLEIETKKILILHEYCESTCLLGQCYSGPGEF